MTRRLPISTAVLAVGALSMSSWEHHVLGPFSSAPVGLVVLAVGVIALTVELRGPAALWSRRSQLLLGPALLMVVGAGLTAVLVAISSRTNGCQCGGASTAVMELAVWAFLVGIVVLVAPRSAPVLLAATALGCFVAGAAALAGVHASATEMAPGSLRLAGAYGNSNFLAATQALGLPIAVAAFVQCRRAIVRIVALAVGLTLTIALLLTYSRSGLIAAAGATATTILLLATPRRRLALGAGMTAAAALVVLVLYPTYATHRTHADFAGQIALAGETDLTGWRRGSTGLIRNGPSELINAGPKVLRVTATRPGEGASVRLGSAAGSVALHLRFQARAAPPVRLGFGLEDNLIAADPASASALVSARWRTYKLTWRPSSSVFHARAYFWVPAIGAFELRRPATWTTDPRHLKRLPTRLLGPGDLNHRLQHAEAAYINSREGAARIAVDAFLAHPFVGIGWERFPAYADTRSGVGAIATHNEYLQFAAELGILGVLAIVLLAVAAGWAALDVRTSRLGPALIGVLVAGGIALAFGNFLEVPSVVLPLATAAATAVALSARRRGGQPISDP